MFRDKKQGAINVISFLQLEIPIWDFALKKKKNGNLCNDIRKIYYSLFILTVYLTTVVPKSHKPKTLL